MNFIKEVYKIKKELLKRIWAAYKQSWVELIILFKRKDRSKVVGIVRVKVRFLKRSWIIYKQAWQRYRELLCKQ